MAANNASAERRVVPRWRTFRETLASGELSSVALEKAAATEGTEFLNVREQSWQDNRTLPFALDFVSAASVLGTSAAASEAAQFVLEHGESASVAAQSIAKTLLGITQSPPAEPQRQERIHVISGIKNLKARRISQPKNAFVWMDLARLYVTLGQIAPAQEALQVARALAPTERFVLRATTRFLLHAQKPDEALWLLRSNPRTPFDPWLLAAEVAVSSVLGKSAKFASTGQQLLAHGDTQPHHKSELACALAAMEMEHGRDKRAVRLFTQCLEDPTDNALAQVVWASSRLRIGQVNSNLLKIPYASEALTFDAFNKAKWSEVVVEADGWSKDESFSARPRLLASSIAASLLDEAKLGEQIAREGLTTNPGHPGLVNNVAFALVQQGESKQALSFLESAVTAGMTPVQGICLLATTGLVHYRIGKTTEGREFYEKAIKAAENHGQDQLEIVATLYFARERVLSGDLDGAKQFLRAYERAKNFLSPNVPAIAEKLKLNVDEAVSKAKVMKPGLT